MQKNLFKIISTFIIIVSLFCGCGTTDKSVASNKQEVTQEERASEYGENDKPWGDCNYKKVGIIKDFNKNLEDNTTTAVLTVDGENTEDKLIIYGTNIDISDYEGRKAFIAAVRDKDVSEEYILVKRYEDINLEKLDLIDSVKNLNSIDNNSDLNSVKSNIDSLKNIDYKNYVMSMYNSKVSELTEKKKKEDEQRKVLEDQQAEKQKQEEEQRKQEEQQRQQEAQSRQTQVTNNNQTQNIPTNGENVYVAASGNGECYHSSPNCSKMKGNVNSMSRSQAEQSGYRPCKKCYR